MSAKIFEGFSSVFLLFALSDNCQVQVWDTRKGSSVKSLWNCYICSLDIYGCFLKFLVPPISTPKWSFLVGKAIVVGETHHLRTPPYWKMRQKNVGVFFLSVDFWELMMRMIHGSVSKVFWNVHLDKWGRWTHFEHRFFQMGWETTAN